MTLDIYAVGSEKIDLSVSKNNINIFLSHLWDDFNQTIGRVGAQHSYSATDNTQIYSYTVIWSDQSLPFIAKLSFYNHTQRGLLYVLLATIDRNTKKPEYIFNKLIKESISRCLSTINNTSATCKGYLKVPLTTHLKLSGNYYLNLTDIIILLNENINILGCYIIFPVFSNIEADFFFEGQTKITTIVSVLTTATQNLFIVDETEEWAFVSKEEYHNLKSTIDFSGKNVCDEGLIEEIEFFTESGAKILVDDQQTRKDIIEDSDCIVNGHLYLPERLDSILNIVQNDYKLRQSCRRFHEAIIFRDNSKHRTRSTIHYIAYELLAYVAAIEALLNSQFEKIEVKCSSCGETSHHNEDRKISKKFRDFITKYNGNSALDKVFKDLYDDRSKFVHMGNDLCTLYAEIPNRPFILEGKKHLRSAPYYYHNIHEYTGYILRKFIYSKLLNKDIAQ